MSDKAIFLDRDETLIEDPGYISSPEQVKLLDGVAEALVELKALGYKLIIATNQSAVARGIVTEKTLGQVHDRLKQLLAEKGAGLDAIYYCPYHPEGVVPKYRKESNCRKPGPGMLLSAADELDIDLEESWCIGDSERDVEAGLRAGCRTILIDARSHPERAGGRVAMVGVNPDYRAVNLREVVNIIKKYHRSPAEDQAKAQSTSAAQMQEAPPVEQPAPELAEPVSQTEGQQPQSEAEGPAAEFSEKEGAARTTEELLGDILAQLKSMQRAELFGEFSIMRLMAGVVQIVVLFCLLITIWFLMNSSSWP